MAKIEIKYCFTCKRETLHTWMIDYLDLEKEENPEFFLMCLACSSISPGFDEPVALDLPNAKLDSFKGGMEHGLG